ncbi:hypothetical protein [Gulosibacter sp. 10]|uniref:hypothetical protein n=1 Tax=Gulosibacter sp. 10 TaxID=1255570 RepID=UPI000B354F5E|nr:hypothetical protein [Gulosibacter sp. 10]
MSWNDGTQGPDREKPGDESQSTPNRSADGWDGAESSDAQGGRPEASDAHGEPRDTDQGNGFGSFSSAPFEQQQSPFASPFAPESRGFGAPPPPPAGAEEPAAADDAGREPASDAAGSGWGGQAGRADGPDGFQPATEPFSPPTEPFSPTPEQAAPGHDTTPFSPAPSPRDEAPEPADAQPTEAFDRSSAPDTAPFSPAPSDRAEDQAADAFGQASAHDTVPFSPVPSGRTDDQPTEAFDRGGFDQGGFDQPTRAFDAQQGFGQDFASDRDAAAQQDAQPTEAYRSQDWNDQSTGAGDAAPWAASAAPWEDGRQAQDAPQVFGAPPAALPGDQHVPFSGFSGGPDLGGPGGPGGPTGPGAGGPGGTGPNDGAPKRKKKWFKRKAIMIPAIVGVVLIAGAAIATPLIIHNNNVNRGDELAAAFQSDLESYQGTWNEESLAAVSAVDISTPISASARVFFDLNSENRTALDDACAAIPTAQEKREELANADVPSLPEDEGATASEAYVQAQADAEKLNEQRTQADAFLSTSESSLATLGEFCGNYAAYADLYDELESNIDGVLADANVVEEGGRIEIEEANVYYECNASGGCPNLYDDDTREQFAAAMETTYVNYYSELSTLYSDQCFLTDFQAVCDVAATEYQSVSDAWAEVVDHLRTTEPTTEVDQPLYPELDGLGQATSDAEVSAENAILTEWQNIEPSAYSMTTTGTSLGTYFDQKVQAIRDAATAVLEG